jgi:glycosyltransferase involved in cell wall biosynthesis
MDMAPIEARIAELDLGSVIEIRARRQSEEEMALLFAQADCFVFPYHQIDASGVYFLTKAFSKWMIASRVGIFAEDMREEIDGRLIPVGDVAALAEALGHAIEARPSGALPQASDSWTAIGHQTRALYESTMQSHARRLSPPART